MELIKPPFTAESASESVQMAEDLWNENAVEQIVKGFSIDGFYLRYRGRVIITRPELTTVLEQKWKRELDYTIEKSLNIFADNQIAVQFMYEWRNSESEYFRTYGNEFWEVNSKGQIIYHTISSNDLKIEKSDLQLIGS